MSPLTPKQRREVERLVDDHHKAFMVELCGRDMVSTVELERLEKAGLLRLRGDDIASVYVAGTLLGDADESVSKSLGADRLDDMMIRLQRALTRAEREAISVAKTKIGEHIKDLGRRINSKTGQVITNADEDLRQRRLKTLCNQTAQGIASKASVEDIAARVRSITKDSQRDWLKIVQTELHNALEAGKASAIASSLPPGSDPRVFKRPHPDCCSYCKILYLERDGVTPRVFTLSELTANGSNVGRKARRPVLVGRMKTQWRPVIGAAHPFCRCSLYHLPAGMSFDRTGAMMYTGAKKSMSVDVVSIDRASKD